MYGLDERCRSLSLDEHNRFLRHAFVLCAGGRLGRVVKYFIRSTLSGSSSDVEQIR